jgi:hypothetical protein
MDRRLDGLDTRLDGMDRRFDAIDTRFDVMARHIDASAAETRRHFEVIAESMLSKIQLVAEGVLTVDRKVDRLAAEVRGELARVNRRMLVLSARIPPRRRR